MSEFIHAAQLSDIPDPGKELAEVNDRLVVIFHVDGKVYCLDDVCTHDSGTLEDGQLDGTTIACSRHGAKFDICTGNAVTMPATKATVAHEVKIEGDNILIKLNENPVDVAEGAPPAVKSTGGSILSSSAVAATRPVGDATQSSAPAAAAETPATEASSTSLPGTGLSEDHVREELKKVIDPELFVNIVDLGLIYVVDLKKRDDGKFDIGIDMTMTSPACPAGPQLISNSKNVVGQLEEVADVEIRIVMDPPWTPDCMTDDARDQLGIF